LGIRCLDNLHVVKVVFLRSFQCKAKTLEEAISISTSMKKLSVLCLALAATIVPAVANAQTVIMGGDGSYLGLVSSDQYDKESICNRYGEYGSPYNQNSIFNHYGTYGGEYSKLGAYNTRADSPPAVVENGKVVLIISKDTSLNPNLRIDPDMLRVQACGEPL
jgi:hypothetical protein